MAKRKRVTIADKKKLKQRTDFVGRQSQLRDFNANLQLGPDDENFQVIWNIHGHGGVGKTTLMGQFVEQARKKDYALAIVDVEDPKMRAVPAALESLVRQFETAGIAFKDFGKRYEDYQQARGKIANDPDKPSSLTGDLVAGGLKTAGKIGAEFVPGGGMVMEHLPIDRLANKAGEWTSYLFKKLGSEDDVRLVQDPLAVLTPLLLEPLLNAWDNDRNFAIVLDTYETHDPALDEWLLRLFKEDYGEVPAFMLIVAGRKPLDSAEWQGQKLVRPLELNPFTPEEVEEFLRQRGFEDADEIEKIHTLTGGLPVFLDMIAKTGPGGDYGEGKAHDLIVTRFLKHIKDPVEKNLALRAALVNRLDKDIVTFLLENKDRGRAAELFEELKNRPFVQRRAGDWAYHPVVRDIMRPYQKAISPTEFAATHEALADYYKELLRLAQGEETEPPYEDANYRSLCAEYAYHRLTASYRAYLPEITRMLAAGTITTGASAWLPLMEYFREAEKDIVESLTWGTLWLDAVTESGKEKVVLLQLSQKLNKTSWLVGPEVKAFWWKLEGELSENYDRAIACYEEALKIKPDYHEAHNSMGNVYDKKEDYDRAIGCFEAALEIKPDDHTAHYNMGNSYDEKGDYDRAIGCYEAALKIKPDEHEAQNNMGIAYGKKGDYDRAIDCFEAAVKIKPDKHEAQNNMGITYGKKGELDRAITCYEAALKIKPDKHEAHYNMGDAYGNKGDYDQAILCYEEALKIKPNNHEALHSIAWYHLLQHKFTQAKTFFQKCWEQTKGQHSLAAMNLGHTHLLTGNSPLALEWYQRSLPLFEGPEAFFKDMKSDYKDLRMEELEISSEAYEEILTQLRESQE